jgi:hypothetical protein
MRIDTTISEESEASKQAKEEKRAKGEHIAANIRYGESISEHGFGGETVGNSGGVDASETEDAASARAASGYGSGSGVGA